MRKWLQGFAALVLAVSVAAGGLSSFALPGEEPMEGYGDDVVFHSPEELQAIAQHDQLVRRVDSNIADNTLPDTDGDGFPDEWEINGIDYDGDGTIDYPLHELGADPLVPDIYVEIDWMGCMTKPPTNMWMASTQP